MQTHYMARSLKYEIDLRTFFAIHPGRKAIVFVHGYGGDSISTWSEFDRLCLGRPEFDSYDLMFYGYDGLRSELIASSTLFYEFLSWLFDAPVSAINDSLAP